MLCCTDTAGRTPSSLSTVVHMASYKQHIFPASPPVVSSPRLGQVSCNRWLQRHLQQGMWVQPARPAVTMLVPVCHPPLNQPLTKMAHLLPTLITTPCCGSTASAAVHCITTRLPKGTHVCPPPIATHSAGGHTSWPVLQDTACTVCAPASLVVCPRDASRPPPAAAGVIQWCSALAKQPAQRCTAPTSV